MTPPQGMRNKLDDQDYPASTPLTPGRSAGRQRRYSRADLALAIRVRELLDQNMPLTAATRIVSLERQLAAAHQRIAHLEHASDEAPGEREQA